MAGPVRAQICKWVDEEGVTHYARECPELVDGKEIEIDAPPSEQQLEDAKKRAEALLQQPMSDSVPASKPAQFRSLPMEQLGPLPGNTTSTYLQTTGADLTFDLQNLGQFFLSLEATEQTPQGAYIEAHFPNPANPDRKNVVDEELEREGATLRMLSPKAGGFKCWNYEVEVFVYRDRTKAELLGTHRQTIQSRVDLSLLNNASELVTAMATVGGICPSAHQRDMEHMSVAELEALCEREREKRLKPEREALIKQCIGRGDRNPDWCERYYSDWGDAMRLDIHTVRLALYYDLPECVAADRARQESKRR
jgi:hypothetical protein